MKNIHLQNQNQFNAFFEERFIFGSGDRPKGGPTGNSSTPKKPRVAMVPNLNNLGRQFSATVGKKPQDKPPKPRKAPAKPSSKTATKEELNRMLSEKKAVEPKKVDRPEVSIVSWKEQLKEMNKPEDLFVFINGLFSKLTKEYLRKTKGSDGKTLESSLADIQRLRQTKWNKSNAEKVAFLKNWIATHFNPDRTLKLFKTKKKPELSKNPNKAARKTLKKQIEQTRIPALKKKVDGAIDKINNPKGLIDFISGLEKTGYRGQYKEWGKKFLASIGIKNVKPGELRSYIRAAQISLQAKINTLLKRKKGKELKIFDGKTSFDHIDGLWGPKTTAVLATYIKLKYPTDQNSQNIKVPGLTGKYKKYKAKLTASLKNLADYVPNSGFVSPGVDKKVDKKVAAAGQSKKGVKIKKGIEVKENKGSSKSGVYAMAMLAKSLGYTAKTEKELKLIFSKPKSGIICENGIWKIAGDQGPNMPKYKELNYQSINHFVRRLMFDKGTPLAIKTAQRLQNAYNKGRDKFKKSDQEKIISVIAPKTLKKVGNLKSKEVNNNNFQEKYTKAINEIKKTAKWTQLKATPLGLGRIRLERHDHQGIRTEIEMEKDGKWSLGQYAKGLNFKQAVLLGGLLNFTKKIAGNWNGSGRRPFEIDSSGNIDYDNKWNPLYDTAFLSTGRKNNWIDTLQTAGISKKMIVNTLNNWCEYGKQTLVS